MNPYPLEPIQKNIHLVTPSYTIHIDGIKNMYQLECVYQDRVVFSIGNHKEEDFELPMLSLTSLSPILYVSFISQV